MVARRDLLRLLARSDHDIQADLDRRLKEEILALQRLTVGVTGGVVTIDAAAGPLARQLLEGLARTVLGVGSRCLVRFQGAEPAAGDRLPDGPGAQGRTAPDGGPHPGEGGGGRDEARRREAKF